MGITSNVLKDIDDYNVSLDVVSLDPTDSAGSTGSLSATGVAIGSNTEDTGFGDLPLLRNKSLSVTDPTYGTVWGRITDVSESDFKVSLSGDTILNRFNVDLTISPFHGKVKDFLDEHIKPIFDTPDIVYSTEVGNMDVSAPGFKGNGWVYLKFFMQVYRIDLVLGAQGEYLFTPTRYTEEEPYNPELSGFSRNVNDQQISRQVAVNYFNHMSVDDGEVYPIEENDDAQVFQVEAGETLITEVKLDAWLSSVNQPKVIDYVEADTDATGTNGVYCVAGNDGLGVKASQWTAQGGRLIVRLTDDPSVIEITVIAPDVESLPGMDEQDDRFSPYAIAATSGNLYNSLHMTGTGTKFREKSLTLDTGASHAVVGEDVGATVDNPFVSTLSDAYDVGLRASQSYAGPHYTVGLTSPAVPSEFFGEPLGKRVITDDVNFRVHGVTHTASGVSVDGTMDTTIADHNEEWSGKTIAQFNTEWDGKTFGEHAVIPLRKEK